MSYRINEVFYSLQGEGRHTGRAAVFVRFSGCNLRCPFCDTDFSHYTEMSLGELLAAIKPWRDCGFVVLTGGEPSLQADEALVDALHGEGYTVAMETNGTHSVPAAVDWVTVSPKSCFVEHAPAIVVQKIDEVKVVFDGQHDPQPFRQLGNGPYLCLQPCDTGDARRNQDIMRQCVGYILQHPEWHLSLQTHKWLDIR